MADTSTKNPAKTLGRAELETWTFIFHKSNVSVELHTILRVLDQFHEGLITEHEALNAVTDHAYKGATRLEAERQGRHAKMIERLQACEIDFDHVGRAELYISADNPKRLGWKPDGHSFYFGKIEGHGWTPMYRVRSEHGLDIYWHGPNGWQAKD